jgi:hypothetical protein
MSDGNKSVMDAIKYNFDPTYGYSLNQLLDEAANAEKSPAAGLN